LDLLDAYHPTTDLDEYKTNDMRDTVTDAKDMPGIIGTHNIFSWRVIKHFAAKVKHHKKYDYLSAKRRDFIVVPDLLTEAATEGQVRGMVNVWKDTTKEGRKPWQYDRVFCLGVVWYRGAGNHIKGGHAYLVFLNATQNNVMNVHIWDSGWGGWEVAYGKMREYFKRWLRIEGWKGEFKWKDHRKDIPLQMDPVFCGQYMIHTAEQLMIGNKKPLYDGYKADPNEAPYQFDNPEHKYEYGKVDAQGNPVHASLDEVVKNFSKQKVFDLGKIKKWQVVKFRGFKRP
jgi:hypothetical protein